MRYGTNKKWIEAIRDYGDAVMESTKYEGMHAGKNAVEKAAAIRLLKLVLTRKPTPEEVDSIIPG